MKSIGHLFGLLFAWKSCCAFMLVPVQETLGWGEQEVRRPAPQVACSTLQCPSQQEWLHVKYKLLHCLSRNCGPGLFLKKLIMRSNVSWQNHCYWAWLSWFFTVIYYHNDISLQREARGARICVFNVSATNNYVRHIFECWQIPNPLPLI